MLTVCLPYMYIDEAVEFTSVCVRVWTITDNQDPLEFTQQSLKNAETITLIRSGG